MTSILVVDDNNDSLQIARTILEQNGYEVTLARGGHEALETIGKTRPDLLLLDVMMPEISGFEVLKQLRESLSTARLPVILLTAKTQDEDIIGGYQGGADYYITKPFTSKQLLYGISLVLDQKAAS